MKPTLRLGPSLSSLALVAICVSAAVAYIDIPPPTLGELCFTSRNIYYLKVEKASAERGVIVFKTAKRLRGAEGITDEDAAKHVVGKEAAGRNVVLDWATANGADKTAVFFNIHAMTRDERRSGHGYVYFDNYWYVASYDGKGECWRLVRGDPTMLTRYCGTPEELREAVAAILDHKEVDICCMADADKDALAERRGKVQVLKASLMLRNYDPKRDFVKWASDQ